MPRKGYNVNSPDEIHQPSTYVPQPSTFSNKSIYPPMTSEERDNQIAILLQEKKEIQNKMDIADDEAKANSEASEHNKNKIDELQKQKQPWFFSHVASLLRVGNTHKLNENIKDLQSEQAKHELHDQELFEKVREYVLIQQNIKRQINDAKQAFNLARSDNTDSHRLSPINANYFRICKFIERYVTNFTLIEPSNFALMHALANEVSIQNFGNKGYEEPTDALYDYEIDDNMLIATSNKMEIFKNENNLKAFLEQARTDEKAKQREKAESSRQQRDAHNKARSSRPKLSVVHPDAYKASQKSKRTSHILQKSSYETKNLKKRGGTRRTRKSKK